MILLYKDERASRDLRPNGRKPSAVHAWPVSPQDCEVIRKISINSLFYLPHCLFGQKLNSPFSRFRNVANASLLSISSALEGGKDVETLVDKHMSIVGKMKRRMKQMLDVTEKYAVEDIFETINLLQQMSNKIKLSPIEDDSERAHRLSRRSQSLTVLGVDSVDGPSRKGGSKDASQHSFSSSSSRRSLSPLRPSERGSIGEGGGAGGRKMNTFKTFSDHLAVLTKTYTNRR